MRSLVIGASGGIGAALVEVLALRGEVVGLSRREDGLDVTDEGSVARVMQGVSGQFDLVFVATGALEIGGARPEKALRAITADAMAAQFALNAIGPALVVKHAIRLLPKDREARIGVLSARVGSIGDNALGGWYSYRAAKAAVNQISHPLAVLACLHPGTVETELTLGYTTGHPKRTPQEAARNLLRVLDEVTPAQSGCFVDWQGLPIPW